MEKIVVSNEARNKRIASVIEIIHNVAKNYARDGFDKFKISVQCTSDEFYIASVTLNEYGIFKKDYTHNGMLGKKSIVTGLFEINW